MTIFEPSGAWACIRYASGTTTTFLKPLCSSDCFSFCCVSSVTAVSGGTREEVEVSLGWPPVMFDVCANAGAASRTNDAIVAKAGTRMLHSCGLVTCRQHAPRDIVRPI